MSIQEKQFDFLSALTAIVVIIYTVTLCYALVQKIIAFELFAAAMSTPVGALLGYWKGGPTNTS